MRLAQPSVLTGNPAAPPGDAGLPRHRATSRLCTLALVRLAFLASTACGGESSDSAAGLAGEWRGQGMGNALFEFTVADGHVEGPVEFLFVSKFVCAGRLGGGADLTTVPRAHRSIHDGCFGPFEFDTGAILEDGSLLRLRVEGCFECLAASCASPAELELASGTLAGPVDDPDCPEVTDSWGTVKGPS